MSEEQHLPSILAIHAHPDDIELQCAGMLLLMRQAGCSVTVATMTPGDCGSCEHDAEAIADIRRKEAAKAAEILGGDYHCLEFRDLSIEVSNDSRRRVTEFIRRVNPDLIVTAPPADYMGDHEATSRLVRDAAFNAPIPNYKTLQWDPAPATERIPALFYVDPIEGTDCFGEPVSPHFVVDVSDVFETKIEMLACHDSQRSWLKRQHGLDEYLDSCRRWSQKRGSDAGFEYGEGFRQHLGHPYPNDNQIGSILLDKTRQFGQNAG